MAYSRNRNNNDGPYAMTFKPAKVLGYPTIDTLENDIYLSEQKEDYDSNGNQMFYENVHGTQQSNEVDLKSIYTLQTSDPDVNPTVRAVAVKSKSTYSNCFLVEEKLNARGVYLVMLKEESEAQVFCNVRMLPYDTVSDLISDTQGPIVEIVLPKKNIAKLNITLEASSTGEVLYRTHKTEVNFESLTEDQIIEIKRNLEFKAAQFVASYCSQYVDIQPSSNSNAKNSKTANFALSVGAFSIGPKLKKALLWAGLTATAVAVAGSVGILAGVTIIGAPVLAVVAGTGGILRNTVALGAPKPTLLDKGYNCVVNGNRILISEKPLNELPFAP